VGHSQTRRLPLCLPIQTTCPSLTPSLSSPHRGLKSIGGLLLAALAAARRSAGEGPARVRPPCGHGRPSSPPRPRALLRMWMTRGDELPAR